MTTNGHALAASVDPNTSDDVCTFCRHARHSTWEALFEHGPDCTKGHDSVFRSLSNLGPIYVSDCGEGALRPELAAVDRTRGDR